MKLCDSVRLRVVVVETSVKRADDAKKTVGWSTTTIGRRYDESQKTVGPIGKSDGDDQRRAIAARRPST